MLIHRYYLWATATIDILLWCRCCCCFSTYRSFNSLLRGFNCSGIGIDTGFCWLLIQECRKRKTNQIWAGICHSEMLLKWYIDTISLHFRCLDSSRSTLSFSDCFHYISSSLNHSAMCFFRFCSWAVLSYAYCRFRIPHSPFGNVTI